MKKPLLIALLGIAFALPLAAQARGGYVGWNGGLADHKATIGGFSESDEQTGYKLYGGFDFTKDYGVEAGYVNLGKFNQSFSDSNSSASLSYKATGVYVAGTGAMPLNSQFSLFAKLGISVNSAKVSSTFNGVSTSDTETNTAAVLGVGAAYHFTNKVSAVVEYEYFGKMINEVNSNVTADMLSVGLRYKF